MENTTSQFAVDGCHLVRRVTSALAEEETIWINSRSGLVHLPGGRWFARTIDGYCLTVQDARAKGYTKVAKR